MNEWLIKACWKVSATLLNELRKLMSLKTRAIKSNSDTYFRPQASSNKADSGFMVRFNAEGGKPCPHSEHLITWEGWLEPAGTVQLCWLGLMVHSLFRLGLSMLYLCDWHISSALCCYRIYPIAAQCRGYFGVLKIEAERTCLYIHNRQGQNILMWFGQVF